VSGIVFFFGGGGIELCKLAIGVTEGNQRVFGGNEPKIDSTKNSLYWRENNHESIKWNQSINQPTNQPTTG
jgi:hypothetical protein